MPHPSDVTIVIPCYQQAHLLPDALDSVRRQASVEVEIIVVDDGSSQDVAAVLRSVAPEAIFIRQANQGLAGARNTGLSASSSGLITFLDADDRLLPGGLAAGMACLADHPECGFVFGGYTNVDSAGRSCRPSVMPKPGPVSYGALLARNLVGMHGAVLYRRQAIVEAGGFDAGLRSCEDHDLYLRMARRHPVQAHATLVAEYRRHSGTLSGQSLDMIEAGLAVLRRQRPLLASRDLRRAYQAGLRFTIAKYGFQFARQVAARVARGELRRSAAEIGAFARRVPRWLSP
jgi:glycosyltransferase involved in cell wall biosynthesis